VRPTWWPWTLYFSIRLLVSKKVNKYRVSTNYLNFGNVLWSNRARQYIRNFTHQITTIIFLNTRVHMQMQWFAARYARVKVLTAPQQKVKSGPDLRGSCPWASTFWLSRGLATVNPALCVNCFNKTKCVTLVRHRYWTELWVRHLLNPPFMHFTNTSVRQVVCEGGSSLCCKIHGRNWNWVHQWSPLSFTWRHPLLSLHTHGFILVSSAIFLHS
jgi:hypothetical protein